MKTNIVYTNSTLQDVTSSPYLLTSLELATPKAIQDLLQSTVVKIEKLLFTQNIEQVRLEWLALLEALLENNAPVSAFNTVADLINETMGESLASVAECIEAYRTDPSLENADLLNEAILRFNASNTQLQTVTSSVPNSNNTYTLVA